MNLDKIQPRLVTDISLRNQRGFAEGLTESKIAKEKITVSIVHKDKPIIDDERSTIKRRESRKKILEDLESNFDASQEPILKELEKVAKGQSFTKSMISNSIVADLTPTQIGEISEIDSVKIITLESEDSVTCMNESVNVIDVPAVWKELHINGKGVKVAILDTGIDKTHPALSGQVIQDFNTTGQPLTPPGLHSTHVAGTVASKDHIYRGVAYGAKLINGKVLTSSGSGQPQWVINGIHQAILADADVISLSLGWSQIYHGWVCDDADCILCRAADTAVHLDCNVVIAAGNEDNANQQPGVPPGLSNIRCPGNARNVITVGAVDKAKQLASFSSIGPGTARLYQGLPTRMTKPDLSAPGVSITSCFPGGGFGVLSGTSMATPHISGLVALLLDKDKDESPKEIKNILKHTTEHAPYTVNETGAGIVNAYTAVSHSY